MKEKFKSHLTTILIIGAIILYFVLSYTVGVGFTENPNVYLEDFTVSEDGSQITIKTTVSSPSESIRNFSSITSGNVQYLDFYYTFGVSSSTLGAKDEFVVEINEDCIGIYFLREDGYELMLYKNPETSEWEIPEKEAEE